MKSFFILFLVNIAFVFNVSASETAKGMKKDFETFKSKMSEKLDATEKKLGEMKTKAQAKGDKAAEKTVETLEETRGKLEAELGEAKSDSKSAWQRFKKSFAESVDALNAKIQKAMKD